MFERGEVLSRVHTVDDGKGKGFVGNTVNERVNRGNLRIYQGELEVPNVEGVRGCKA
jgi:hypothetical protein